MNIYHVRFQEWWNKDIHTSWCLSDLMFSTLAQDSCKCVGSWNCQNRCLNMSWVRIRWVSRQAFFELIPWYDLVTRAGISSCNTQVACSAPSHYLNQCWLIVNLNTARNISSSTYSKVQSGMRYSWKFVFGDWTDLFMRETFIEIIFFWIVQQFCHGR